MATWTFESLRSGYEWETELSAYWELFYDPVSDDYTPQEMNAVDLLYLWFGIVEKEHPNKLIPIFWCVKGEGIFEAIPFQFCEYGVNGKRDHDFLTYFSWPYNRETGRTLNWLSLPVVDKLWSGNRSDKGGFIQSATGWKPAILQPYVYLPSLLENVNVSLDGHRYERPSKANLDTDPKQAERMKATPKLRSLVMERDGFKCVRCGKTAQDGARLEVDHIMPVSKGGLTEIGNLQTLCSECNIGKGARIPQ